MSRFRRRGGVATGRAALRQSGYKITEHDQAVVVARWADLMGSTGAIPALQWLYAVPNGGLRSPATAGKLRAEGVKPGVSDYVLPVKRQRYIGFFGELKTRTGVLSADQKAWLTGMTALGHCTVAAWEADAMIEALLDYVELPRADRQALTGRDPDAVRKVWGVHGTWWEYRVALEGDRR